MVSCQHLYDELSLERRWHNFANPRQCRVRRHSLAGLLTYRCAWLLVLGMSLFEQSPRMKTRSSFCYTY